MNTAGPVPNHGIRNAMTVDVEDYFHVSAFENHICRGTWDELPCRVERNVDRILQLFAEHDTKATFFYLGWVAKRYPELVRRTQAEGHEIASHGWSHIRATEQTPEAFRQDVSRTRALLEDTVGAPVLGYRAASYSIGRDNLWALDTLQETGHRYSSSIYPVHHDLYGMPEAPRFSFRPGQGDLVEIPVTTVEVLGKKLPCGGGGYFRLLPYEISRWAIRQVNQRDRQAAVFYFHPWEIDPDQPRQNGLGLKTRVRHYLNLSRTEGRLKRLLSDFQWGRMDRIFLEQAVNPA
ncbi:polysaccharide deacetylase family protein [Ectothiorhodospira shaposhnikovii]|uniref:XrtA system polysaccharide deacetylase n=1 Tax=Ectothiorhodospira shaposhnikovii TaxID=1054 RepID=UPI0019055AD2|nr:XrtA system polysaccharide deacetylase [Ectothiorhodospira shaposhnikovii]MBK1672772.1 polysaccharide deacetylase family protein [Ectothiorhodospira shaposhnikovii]